MPATLAEAAAIVLAGHEDKCCVQRWLDQRSEDDRQCFEQLLAENIRVRYLWQALLSLDDVTRDTLFGETALRCHVRGTCICPR